MDTKRTDKAEQLVRNILNLPDLKNPLMIHNLIECIEKLQTSTTLYYDKMAGRWLFSSLHEDEWAHIVTKIESGVNFCFIGPMPESVIIDGLLYLDSKNGLNLMRGNHA